MTRHSGDCCHYDDGYDDGFEDGKEDASASKVAVTDALRLLARERFLYGEEAEAALLEKAADQIESDPFLEKKLGHEGKSREWVIAEYAKAKAARA